MKLILIIIVISVVVGFFFLKVTGNKKTASTYKYVKLEEPKDWPQFQMLLDKNTLPSIHITLSDDPLKLRSQSKFGGKPYWPKNKKYPVGKDGKPLSFLAQINFLEFPGELENYPKVGLLQFFISNDDFYGADIIDEKNTLEKHLKNNKNYTVIYHSEISSDPLEVFSKEIEELSNSDMSPILGETAISFVLSSDIVSPADYRFKKIIKPHGVLNDDIHDYAYDSLMRRQDHKLGGYASFSQQDPREYNAPNDHWLLLFQIDSDSNDKINIMWGDAGVANFFILPENLANLNFNNVWFNWDSH